MLRVTLLMKGRTEIGTWAQNPYADATLTVTTLQGSGRETIRLDVETASI